MNTLGYETVPRTLQVNYLLLLLYLGHKTNQSSIPSGYIHLLVQGSSETSSVVYGVFIDEEVDGVGGKESGDTTTVDIHTLLEAFLNMSLGSAGFTEEAFFW